MTTEKALHVLACFLFLLFAAFVAAGPGIVHRPLNGLCILILVAVMAFLAVFAVWRDNR
mgnify:CR=1 FL=1